MLILFALTGSGCDGDDPTPTPTPTATPKVDTDGDGYTDDVDFYPYGQDTIDTDGDGISNAYDKNPYNVQVTPSTPEPVTPTAPATGSAPPADRDIDLDGLPDVKDPYPLGEDAYLDSDGDAIPDKDDTDPHLPFDGDSDGDGISNGDDASPFHNDDYDFDGHTNQNDYEPWDDEEY